LADPTEIREQLVAACIGQGETLQRRAVANAFLECLPRSLGEELLGDFIDDLNV
jgi:hypothetical protein